MTNKPSLLEVSNEQWVKFPMVYPNPYTNKIIVHGEGRTPAGKLLFGIDYESALESARYSWSTLDGIPLPDNSPRMQELIQRLSYYPQGTMFAFDGRKIVGTIDISGNPVVLLN